MENAKNRNVTRSTTKWCFEKILLNAFQIDINKRKKKKKNLTTIVSIKNQNQNQNLLSDENG